MLHVTEYFAKSLKVTQGHPNDNVDTAGVCKSLLTFHLNTSVSRTVSQIFSIKECRDLETWGKGHSRSLKMAPFGRPHTTFYWSAIVNIALSCTVLSYLALNNIVTFESGLEVTQGH